MSYTGTQVQLGSSGGRMDGLANDPTFREQVVMREIAYHQGIETPFLTALGTFDIYNPLYSFVMGHIDFDRTTIPADREGKLHIAKGDLSGKYRLRAYNGIHIHSREVAVTDVERATREIGVGDEYEQHIWEEELALAVECENILLWSEFQASGTGGYTDVVTPPRTHGFFAWLYYTGRATGTVQIAGNQIPSPYNATYFAGNGTPMTRNQFNTKLLEPYWAKGGELANTLFFLGSRVKTVISQYAMAYNGSGATLTATPLNSRDVAASAYLLVDKLDIYESDWGTVFTIKNRNMSNTTPFANFGANGSDAAANAAVLATASIIPATSMLGFNPSYLKYGIMFPISYIPTAKLGSSTEGYCESVFGAVVQNPRAMVGGHGLAAAAA